MYWIVKIKASFKFEIVYYKKIMASNVKMINNSRKIKEPTHLGKLLAFNVSFVECNG